MRNLFLTFISVSFFFGCGSPKDELDKRIESQGFIPYSAPTETFRVGTILRGSHIRNSLVARAGECFPDLQKPLRYIDPVSLPNEYKYFELGFNAELNDAISAGSNVISFKLGADFVKSVKIEFGDAAVEYLYELNFERHYDSGDMPYICRSLLERHPFIGKSLRVDSMKFEFLSKSGVKIDLSTRLGEITNIGAGVDYTIENRYSLIINTPKYIGYNMAKLKNYMAEEGRREILYASTIDRNSKWIFESYESNSLDRLKSLMNSYPAELLSEEDY